MTDKNKKPRLILEDTELNIQVYSSTHFVHLYHKGQPVSKYKTVEEIEADPLIKKLRLKQAAEKKAKKD